MSSRIDPPAAPVVIITGASSGIGRCVAGRFAAHGFDVGLIARNRIGLLATAQDVSSQGGRAAVAPADVTDPHALEAATRQLERALGPVAIWVNCAGNGTYGRFLDTPAEEFRRVTDVTYLGTVNGTRTALRRMMPRDCGRIVSVCSAVAFHGMPLLASYSGAKHAVHGFAQSVRAELAQERSRVRLTTVYPPAVNTPFFDHAISHMGRPGRPMAPVYQPEVVAEAICLAALTGVALMPVSFTTLAFALGVRISPGLVARAIRRLGYDGQLGDDPGLEARYEPTLFTVRERVSPAQGAFGAEARGRSLHVMLLRGLAHLAGHRWPGRRRVPEAALSDSATS